MFAQNRGYNSCFQACKFMEFKSTATFGCVLILRARYKGQCSVVETFRNHIASHNKI